MYIVEVEKMASRNSQKWMEARMMIRGRVIRDAGMGHIKWLMSMAVNISIKVSGGTM